MEARYIISTIFLLATVFGVVFNALLLSSTYRSSRMDGSLKMIMRAKSIGNIVMISIFPTYMIIMLLIDFPFLGTHSHVIGTISMILYQSSKVSSLLYSINRTVCVFFHKKYDHYFSVFITLIIIVFIWFWSILYCVFSFEIFGCNVTYDTGRWIFDFTGNCSLPVEIIDLGVNSALSIASVLLNFACVFKKIVRKTLVINEIIKLANENKYVQISMIQNVLIIIGQIGFYIVAPLIGPSHPVIFSLVSNFWGLAPTFEAAMILMTNEIYKVLIRYKNWKRSTTSSPRRELDENGLPTTEKTRIKQWGVEQWIIRSNNWTAGIKKSLQSNYWKKDQIWKNDVHVASATSADDQFLTNTANLFRSTSPLQLEENQRFHRALRRETYISHSKINCAVKRWKGKSRNCRVRLYSKPVTSGTGTWKFPCYLGLLVTLEKHLAFQPVKKTYWFFKAL